MATVVSHPRVMRDMPRLLREDGGETFRSYVLARPITMAARAKTTRPKAGKASITLFPKRVNICARLGLADWRTTPLVMQESYHQKIYFKKYLSKVGLGVISQNTYPVRFSQPPSLKIHDIQTLNPCPFFTVMFDSPSTHPTLPYRETTSTTPHPHTDLAKASGACPPCLLPRQPLLA